MKANTLHLQPYYSIRQRALVLTFALMFGAATFALAHDLSRTPPVTDEAGAAPHVSVAAEAPYLAENDAAMAKMMNDMTVKPTGDVDRDFVAMMVPHHRG